jgi:predicted nuclease with TOPRIM domain
VERLTIVRQYLLTYIDTDSIKIESKLNKYTLNVAIDGENNDKAACFNITDLHAIKNNEQEIRVNNLAGQMSQLKDSNEKLMSDNMQLSESVKQLKEEISKLGSTNQRFEEDIKLLILENKELRETVASISNDVKNIISERINDSKSKQVNKGNDIHITSENSSDFGAL